MECINQSLHYGGVVLVPRPTSIFLVGVYVEYIHLHIYVINCARMAITDFHFVFVETKCVLFCLRGVPLICIRLDMVEKMYEPTWFVMTKRTLAGHKAP